MVYLSLYHGLFKLMSCSVKTFILVMLGLYNDAVKSLSYSDTVRSII